MGHRVESPVNNPTAELARAGGPVNRREQIRPFRHSPYRHCLAEIFIMFFQPQALGRVEQAEQPDRGVNAETQRRGAGALALQLENIRPASPVRRDYRGSFAPIGAPAEHIEIAFGDRLQ